MSEPKWEKMSKSRGNVVLPEEVVYGVCDLDRGFEFRDVNGQVVDWQEINIWRDKLKSGDFFTATRFGRRPVFLHFKDNPVPCMLETDGEERLQHTELWGTYWVTLLEKYE